MADKVKVSITGSVDFGKGEVEKGVYELDAKAADRIVRAGAGVLVHEVKPKKITAEVDEPENDKPGKSKDEKPEDDKPEDDKSGKGKKK